MWPKVKLSLIALPKKNIHTNAKDEKRRLREKSFCVSSGDLLMNISDEHLRQNHYLIFRNLVRFSLDFLQCILFSPKS